MFLFLFLSNLLLFLWGYPFRSCSDLVRFEPLEANSEVVSRNGDRLLISGRKEVGVWIL
jgi:hypothetical protein